ncbi:hypothetical protein [Caloramator sp. Dgby_cultured_2]|uniref:hypothetical protein n=1 Tax=Caloramator sp. Dgby_cultured_2 TaxID=3029174 RepID=UPI00237E3DCF|nr:hypothetical protein [Caloramator sp. Dgby_cultured_2]WDU83450.1 hypothetical protein PWK10_01830 [Caloramator sp. Dgby_cultured_2]
MKAAFVTFYKIEIYCEDAEKIEWENIKVYQESEPIEISIINKKKDHCEIILSEPVDIKRKTYISIKDKCFEVPYSNLFKTEEFNEKYYYNGFLGCRILDDKIEFRVWSPIATSIDLLLYKNGDPTFQEDPIIFNMKEKNGVFSGEVDLKYKGYFYTYKVQIYDKIEEVVDPYAKAVGINGLRAAIIDLEETNPYNWQEDKYVKLENYVDAVIYEISIRDISSNENSNIKKGVSF